MFSSPPAHACAHTVQTVGHANCLSRSFRDTQTPRLKLSWHCSQGSNSTVERKHQSSVRKSMEERLGRVTAQVDTRRRSGYGVPSLVDAKGQMAKMERANQIQKENDLLVKKLQGIRMSQARSKSLICSVKPGILVQAGGAGPKIDMGVSCHSYPAVLQWPRDVISQAGIAGEHHAPKYAAQGEGRVC